jgi:hypothetical protein
MERTKEYKERPERTKETRRKNAFTKDKKSEWKREQTLSSDKGLVKRVRIIGEDELGNLPSHKLRNIAFDDYDNYEDSEED